MDQPTLIRPGMRVLSSDGAELGKVEQVLVSPDGQSVRLLVSGGQMRLSDATITSVSDDEVRIGLSAEAARTTVWGETPPEYTPADSFAWRQPAPTSSEVAADDTVTVERLEETLVPETSWQQRGAIQIRKRVVETPETFNVDVTYEDCDIERVPVNREWQPGEELIRTEGDTTIISLVSEQIEIVKRQVITEELRLTKRVQTRQEQVTETVRREEVEVIDPTGQTGLDSTTA